MAPDASSRGVGRRRLGPLLGLHASMRVGDEATAKRLPRRGDVQLPTISRRVLVGPGLQEATVSVRPRRGPSRAGSASYCVLVLFAPHVTFCIPRLALRLREFDVAPTWNATGVASSAPRDEATRDTPAPSRKS